ncbi:MAG: N-acetylmuramoyl-L-alanine amidase [Verrucomicrobia bacterium]|nr:N-acetylmuramoyl-L-alanine amidase [Verrucomicrobiota bacterium]
MLPAATRLAALGGLILQLAACSHVAGGAVAEKSALLPAPLATAPVAAPALRTAPSRPGLFNDPGSPAPKAPPPLATTRIKNLDYISANEIAGHLGFKGRWDEGKRELTLSSGPRKLVLTADRREVICDDVRIFLGDAVQSRAGKLYVSRTDYERCLVSLLRPDFVTVPVPRLKTIVLDPGHGGGDPGMENRPLRLQEKVLALDVALRLEKLLKAEGYTVVLTRRDDRQLAPSKDADLQRRALIANTSGADLFLSIHFNSLYPDTRVSGTEVYVFTRPGQRSDTSWGFGQADDTERDIAPVNRLDPWTSLLAHALHRETITALKTSDRGHKTKHLGVLRGLKCPGVLIESLFLSNEAEARRAATPAYRQQIAEAMAAGIRSYAATLGRNAPDLPLKQSGGSWTDHFCDLEQLTDAGLDLGKVTSFRYDFIVQFAAGRAAHADKFPAIDPAKNADHTREWPGFAPWAITEYFGRLRSGFGYLKVMEELGTPEEIANAKANIVYLMGVMGHYVGDCAQPLHTTVHHNGWVGENPNGYSKWPGIHSWIDGGLVAKAGITFAALAPRITPPPAIALAAREDGRDPMFVAVFDYLLAQNKLVEPLYQLEKAGKFSHERDEKVVPEGQAFIEGQLLTGGKMLSAIWLAAWKNAVPDTYLRTQLVKRQGGGEPTEKSKK